METGNVAAAAASAVDLSKREKTGAHSGCATALSVGIHVQAAAVASDTGASRAVHTELGPSEQPKPQPQSTPVHEYLAILLEKEVSSNHQGLLVLSSPDPISVLNAGTAPQHFRQSAPTRVD